jgi:hypothetical protein
VAAHAIQKKIKLSTIHCICCKQAELVIPRVEKSLNTKDPRRKAKENNTWQNSTQKIVQENHETFP